MHIKSNRFKYQVSSDSVRQYDEDAKRFGKAKTSESFACDGACDV